jgi:hypothetical protein
MEVRLDGLNFSPRNLQQLLNNLLKDAQTVTLTTIAGDQLAVRNPVELGSEAIAFKSGDHDDTIVVPFHAIQRVRVA